MAGAEPARLVRFFLDLALLGVDEVALRDYTEELSLQVHDRWPALQILRHVLVDETQQCVVTSPSIGQGQIAGFVRQGIRQADDYRASEVAAEK